MSDAAKMEPWRADAERRDCYCAAQRKPCSYHEGYGDGWDAGTDAVLAVVRGVDADQWEQVGWRLIRMPWVFATAPQRSHSHLLPDEWEPVYRRVVPVPKEG